MQATQSNTASGKRSLPSTLAAPIEAARRYLDRQKSRDDAANVTASEQAEGVQKLEVEGIEGSPGLAELRGLYDGQSIEAGLNFESVLSAELFGSEMDGASDSTAGGFSTEPGAAELEFAGAASAAPDPVAVRAAISRLARQSERSRTAALTGMDQSSRVAEGHEAGAAPRLQASGTEPPDRLPVAFGQSDAEAAEVREEGATAGFCGCAAAEAPALAHDAGNLFSALGLYSELLCLAGVLHERHRHYAEDLKLLVERSKVLTERLLRVSRMAQREPFEGKQAGATLAPVAAKKDPTEAEGVPAAKESAAQALPLSVPGAADSLRSDAGSASRREAKPVDVSGPTSLVELLRRWGSLLSTIAHGAIAVQLGPQAGVPIPVGEEALERILVNLVRNASEATREGGSIRVGVGLLERSGPVLVGGTSDPDRVAGRRMVLTVDDSGCGMSEEQVRRILAGGVAGSGEAGEPGDPRRSGHGLGLQIVRELVAASAGELSIQSRKGTGTRIEIQWPTVEDAVAPAVNAAIPNVTPPGIPGGFVESERDAWIHMQRRPGSGLEQSGLEGAIAC